MRSTFPVTASLLATLNVAIPAIAEMRMSEQTESQPTESSLSSVERSKARQWNLTEIEWQRYRHLMAGVRGSLSVSTISPIEVLGIHARDEAELRRYAEQWVDVMRDDAERVLAFQRAYHEAWQRRFPDDQMIDPRRLPEKHSTLDLQPGDRLMFFTAPDCERCDAVLERLLSRVAEASSDVGLDIYLVGDTGGDDTGIRTWAREKAIPPNLVHQGVITLNYDDGLLARLSDSSAAVPHVVHRHGSDFSPVPLNRLGRTR